MRLLTFAAMAGNGMTVGMGGGRNFSGHLHSSSLLVLLSPEQDADAVVSGFTCNTSPRIGNDDAMRQRSVQASRQRNSFSDSGVT